MTTSGSEEDFVIGGPLARVRVSVRVVGDDLDPDEVTRLLGVEPTFAARKGERVTRRTRTGTERARVQSVGVWSHALTPHSSPDWELGAALDELLSRFPEDPGLWALLRARYSVDVFCGLFLGSDNQGADLRPETLGAVARRGLTLSLDIYGP